MTDKEKKVVFTLIAIMVIILIVVIIVKQVGGGNDNTNTTIDKINRILKDCSKEGLNFIYEFTCSINTFLKSENRKL